MKALLLSLLLSAALPGLYAASPLDTDLEKADKAWAAAVVAKDYPALERLFAADLIYAHSTGIVETKQQYIDRLKTGVQRYDRIAHEQVKVVTHGNSAVVHSTLRMNGISNGKEFSDHIMCLHLWVKKGNAWQLAAHQTTKLAQ